MLQILHLLRNEMLLAIYEGAIPNRQEGYREWTFRDLSSRRNESPSLTFVQFWNQMKLVDLGVSLADLATIFGQVGCHASVLIK
jgi:hypothetical protein